MLTVFVATSMAEVLEDLAGAYEERTGVKVQVSASASGVLRRQIELGAACDVFLAADAYEMDRLARGGLILPGSRRDVAANELVVVSRDGARRPWTSLRELLHPLTGKVAIGDPAYVPAGRYAKRALLAAGVWGALQGRLVLGDNVRVVCQYVRAGQAQVGIVYGTDAAMMSDGQVLWTIDSAATGPVVCPGAVVRGSVDAAAAGDLLAYIAAEAQAPVWQRRGFRRPGGGMTSK